MDRPKRSGERTDRELGDAGDPSRPAHHEGDTEVVVVPHFAIRDRDRRLLDVPFDELPTARPYTLMLPQDETERLLRV